MNPAEIGAATAAFFLGFVALFVLGLRTRVGGRFPVARAIAASATATGAAWAVGRFTPLPPAIGLAVALGLAAAVAYRPPWWSLPLMASVGAGIHYSIAALAA